MHFQALVGKLKLHLKARKTSFTVFIPFKEKCTRDFCLLARTNDDMVPSFAELQIFREAGIGRKKVVFSNKKVDRNKVRACLEELFPKLHSQAGAF